MTKRSLPAAIQRRLDNLAALPGAPPSVFAQRVTAEILDWGLGHSTWAEQFPEAYGLLVKWHRLDIAASVDKILNGGVHKQNFGRTPK